MSVSTDRNTGDEQRTILIVDDSAYIRQMIRFALAQHNYRLIESHDGFGALSCLDENQVDLVITDLKMPDMDGFELIRNIRKRPGCEFLPIIMLTVEADEKNRNTARDVGVSAFMVKPFVPEQISGLIKSIFT